MYVRWLEDFRSDRTHLPGAQNPADPLTRSGFADGPGARAGCLDGGFPTRRVISRSDFLGWVERRYTPRRELSFGPGGQQTGGWQRSYSPAFDPSARPSTSMFVSPLHTVRIKVT
jgi:hypothetical protein